MNKRVSECIVAEDTGVELFFFLWEISGPGVTVRGSVIALGDLRTRSVIAQGDPRTRSR